MFLMVEMTDAWSFCGAGTDDVGFSRCRRCAWPLPMVEGRAYKNTCCSPSCESCDADGEAWTELYDDEEAPSVPTSPRSSAATRSESSDDEDESSENEGRRIKRRLDGDGRCIANVEYQHV